MNDVRTTKVAHLTSVHAAADTRILHKECVALAEYGYDVVLIAPHARDDVIRGVRVRGIPREASRLLRMTRSVFRIYRVALEEDCELYHFHDPELIPVGLLLRMRGRQVVYDVHEDYRTSIQQKHYLPLTLRFGVAALVAKFEELASRAFPLVLAERYYLRRFPRGHLVLNYPLAEQIAAGPRSHSPPADGIRLLYTGGVSEDRGALIHASLVTLCDKAQVHVVGRCAPALATRMREVAGDGEPRLFITGEQGHVRYEDILNLYRRGGWTAGLALFPPTPHYREKELTKFFEYMAAGIPILCSDFPVWRSLIANAGCGLTVDPNDPGEIRAALELLISNPGEASAMGQRGREAVRQRFNWRREASGLFDLYVSLVGAPEPRQTCGNHPSAEGDDSEWF